VEKSALRRQQSRMKNPSDVREIYPLSSGRDDMRYRKRLAACQKILMRTDEQSVATRNNSVAIKNNPH
jgi:hypothetical protein